MPLCPAKDKSSDPTTCSTTPFLKQLRLSAHLTQCAMAFKMGWSISNVSKFERKRLPELATHYDDIVAWFKCCGCRSDDPECQKFLYEACHGWWLNANPDLDLLAHVIALFNAMAGQPGEERFKEIIVVAIQMVATKKLLGPKDSAAILSHLLQMRQQNARPSEGATHA